MSTNAIVRETGFHRFGLDDSLYRGLDAVGFEAPRPIQDETIPAALDGLDVLGLAQTGTGKTAAFALPILSRLVDTTGRGPLALVLAPTRELAVQITKEFRDLGQYTGLGVVSIYGGSSMVRQIQALKKKPEIVVGCPGRVLDLVGQKKLDLRRIQTLVLDEADQMFDMGFLPDIKRVIEACPPRRQNLLFSATMPTAIRGLADDLLHNPHVVELAHSAPPVTVDHALCLVEESEKRPLLIRMLNQPDCNSAIVFTRTKYRARRLTEKLHAAKIKATELHGNLSQNQRDRAMRGFRMGKFQVLVATDIAARGIDVPDVSYVINFDVPGSPEAYTHRIGRTGRSAKFGMARTFVTHEDRHWVRDTERVLGMEIATFGSDLEKVEMERAPKPQRRKKPGTSHDHPRNARSAKSVRPRRNRSGPGGRAGQSQPEGRSRNGYSRSDGNDRSGHSRTEGRDRSRHNRTDGYDRNGRSDSDRRERKRHTRSDGYDRNGQSGTERRGHGGRSYDDGGSRTQGQRPHGQRPSRRRQEDGTRPSGRGRNDERSRPRRSSGENSGGSRRYGSENGTRSSRNGSTRSSRPNAKRNGRPTSRSGGSRGATR